MSDVRLARALLILRVGLALFLFLWALDKIVVPDATVGVFDYFYKLSIGVTAARVIGGLEALLALAILFGAWKTWSYGLGLVLHAISTLASWEQLLSPFGDNHLFIAALPVLAAFVALFMLRERDTLWTVPGR